VTGLDFGYSFGIFDCVTTTYCVAHDGHGKEIVYDGTSWSVEPTTFNGSSSCTSTSYCIGVFWFESGLYESWAIYNGVWTTQIGSDQLPQDIAGFFENAISCASSSFCAVALQDRELLTYNGVGWSAPVLINSGYEKPPRSVSCAPNTTFCVAVTGITNGYSWTYANGSWGSAVQVTGEPLYEVSCVTTTFCMAVGGGSALVYNGQSWGAPVVVDTGGGLTGVSCPTTTFCAAVDDKGNTFIYQASATTTTTPGAPTVGTAVAAGASATVHWTAPKSVGSSPITGYTVSAHNITKSSTRANACPSSDTSTATSCTVTGLTNGDVYTFKVAAISSAGTGSFSASSNRVTPKASGKVSGTTTKPSEVSIIKADLNSLLGPGSRFTYVKISKVNASWAAYYVRAPGGLGGYGFAHKIGGKWKSPGYGTARVGCSGPNRVPTVVMAAFVKERIGGCS
jgi:hypothetical protein